MFCETPSNWRFITAKKTRKPHILTFSKLSPPIPIESFSPATVAWQSSDQQGSPPSSSQLASSLEPNQNFLTLLKLLNWDFEKFHLLQPFKFELHARVVRSILHHFVASLDPPSNINILGCANWIYFGFFLNQNINVLRLPWRYSV